MTQILIIAGMVFVVVLLTRHVHKSEKQNSHTL